MRKDPKQTWLKCVSGVASKEPVQAKQQGVIQLQSPLETNRGVRRREFLIAGAGAGLALAGPVNYVALARNRRLPLAREGKFAHGVASGVPSPTAITLWTRLSGVERSSRLRLEVAEDKHFRRLVDQPPRHRAGEPRLHRPRAGRRAEARPRVPLPLPDQGEALPGRALPDPAAARLEAADQDRLLLLPELRGRLLHGPRGARQGAGPRSRPLPRRLHLRAPLLPGSERAEGQDRQEPRRRRADARRVPPEVPPLPDRPQPPGPARHLPLRLGLGRPRGRGQLRRHPARLGVDRPGPLREQQHLSPAGSRSASAAATATGRSSRRCRGCSTRAIRTRSTGRCGSGGLAELFLTDQRQFRDQQPCADVQLTACPDDLLPGRTYLGSKQKAWFKHAVPNSKRKVEALGQRDDGDGP